MTDAIVPPGTRVERTELLELGFLEHALRINEEGGASAFCEWDTLGEVPDAPGLYAFVLTDVHEPDPPRVAYVGMTTHLWMVTKGRLPGAGGSRPAQRYGRHKYAGATRARVNGLVAEARRQGYVVSHWLKPMFDADRQALLSAEGALIARWRLRDTGWNRG